MMRRASLWIAWVALAGCAAPEAPGPSQQEPGNEDAAAGPPSLVPDWFGGNKSMDFTLHDCRNWAVTNEVPQPLLQNDWVPPGWEDTNPQPTVSVAVYLLQCQRIGWGPFERGPVSFVIDSITDRLPPEACRFGGASRFTELANLYVNDADVAAAFHAVLDFPAQAADIAFDVEPGTPDVTRAHWTPLGGQESEFSFRSMGVAEEPPDELLRVFWHNATNLFMLDFWRAGEDPAFDGNAGHGYFAPPMLLSALSEPGYVGPGDTLQVSDSAGHVHRLDDYRCADAKAAPEQTSGRVTLA